MTPSSLLTSDRPSLSATDGLAPAPSGTHVGATRWDPHSPFEHSSPSHGGLSTPRPGVPSPSTTVDSKPPSASEEHKAESVKLGQASIKDSLSKPNGRQSDDRISQNGFETQAGSSSTPWKKIGASSNTQNVSEPSTSADSRSIPGGKGLVSSSQTSVISRSFGHVPLPSELEPELLARNYILKYDPELMKEKGRPEGNRMIKREKPSGPGFEKVEDPRLAHPVRKVGQRLRKPRDALVMVKFAWDQNSPGPPPTHQILVTNLSPRTPLRLIEQAFATYGRIASFESKVDPFTGQNLGIVSVTFAHDFDENGKSNKNPGPNNSVQDGHVAAKAARDGVNGQRFVHSIVNVVLDRDQVKFNRACEAEIARLHPPPKSLATDSSLSPSVAPETSVHSQGSSPAHVRPTSSQHPPSSLRHSRVADDRSPYSESSGRIESTRSGPYSYSSWSSSRRDERDRNGLAQMHGASASHWDARDSERGWRSSRDESGRNGSSRRGPYIYSSSGRSEEVDDTILSTDVVLRKLAQLGHPYVFVPRTKASGIDSRDIRSHFADFSPAIVVSDKNGWYIGFHAKANASRCKMVLNKKTLNNYHLTVELRDPPSATDVAQQSTGSDANRESKASTTLSGDRRPNSMRPTDEPAKTEYTESELLNASMRMIQSDLSEAMIRAIKTRMIMPFITECLKPGGAGGEILSQASQKAKAESALKDARTVSSALDGKLPSFKKNVALDFAIPKKASAEPKEKLQSKSEAPSRRGSQYDVGKGEPDADETATKRSSKAKATSKKAAGAIGRRRLLDFSDDESETESTREDGTDSKSRSVSMSAEPGDDVSAKEAESGKLATKKSSKKSKATSTAASAEAKSQKKGKLAKATAVRRPTPPPADVFESGIAENDEDLYFVRLALERMKQGEAVVEDDWPEEEGADEIAEPHTTGSARSEGFYRIPPSQKAQHLEDRNKTVDENDPEASHNTPVTVAVASARNNRADSRRLVLGIEQHKKEMATDTDILKFNQLRTRKKPLKFAKSPIHDWGLYAMEMIHAGDMVIEYVGEVIRQQVADEREKAYERQGNFSTYLFRVDDDLVVDATHKGNIARLMNVSMTYCICRRRLDYWVTDLLDFDSTAVRPTALQRF